MGLDHRSRQRLNNYAIEFQSQWGGGQVIGDAYA